MTKARDLANGGFGLVLIKPSTVVNGTDNGKGTVSFSAATPSLNNVFSSTYENYSILINLTTNSANDGNIYFRLRANGSDTTTTYYWARRGWTMVSGAGTDGNGDNVSGFTVMTQDSVTAGYSHIQLNVFSPFLGQKTKVSWVGSATTDAANVYSQFGGGVLDNTLSYDGFSLVNQNGTSTGNISVYGYNK